KGGAHDISWPRMNRHLRGRFDRFDPRRVLAFSAWWEHEPEFTKRAGVSFRAFEESTTVMVEHGEYSELSRDPESRQEHLDGWVHFLGRLAAIPPSHGRE
ncbi:MAG: SRPBCC family protein, partial [Thermoplasmata archaeon]